MVSITKILYRPLNKYPFSKIKSKINKLLPRKKCYICKNRFYNFTKYRKASKFISGLNIIGSDMNNFGCPFCGATDRERHLFMFMDKMGIWDLLNKRTLHISPERRLYNKIIELKPTKYTTGDIDPDRYSFCKGIEKIDLTNIQFESSSFDVVIANHVLEHIPDYKKAILEIFRVLDYDGFAILQTPYSEIIKRNFEDPNISSNATLREKFYGEIDHYRIFGQQLYEELVSIGFKSVVKEHKEFFSDKDAFYYGVNKKEPFMLFNKIM